VTFTNYTLVEDLIIVSGTPEVQMRWPQTRSYENIRSEITGTLLHESRPSSSIVHSTSASTVLSLKTLVLPGEYRKYPFVDSCSPSCKYLVEIFDVINSCSLVGDDTQV
jgi:hypothetical protein